MKIDHLKGLKIFRHRLVIHFQYQSINWPRLLSIDIDYRFHRLVTPGFLIYLFFFLTSTVVKSDSWKCVFSSIPRSNACFFISAPIRNLQISQIGTIASVLSKFNETWIFSWGKFSKVSVLIWYDVCWCIFTCENYRANENERRWEFKLFESTWESMKVHESLGPNENESESEFKLFESAWKSKRLYIRGVNESWVRRIQTLWESTKGDESASALECKREGNQLSSLQLTFGPGLKSWFMSEKSFFFNSFMRLLMLSWISYGNLEEFYLGFSERLYD